MEAANASDDSLQPDHLMESAPLPRLSGVLGSFQWHASEALGEALLARHATEGEVEQVVSYAVRVAAEHRMGPQVDWIGLSSDGQRVGLRDAVGVMWDFGIGEALRESAASHLEQAQAIGRSPAQVVAAPVVAGGGAGPGAVG